MFITSNHASFHLRLKKNLVRHEKVSKYHEHGCKTNNCGVWLYEVGQNRETDEEHDQHFFEERF